MMAMGRGGGGGVSLLFCEVIILYTITSPTHSDFTFSNSLIISSTLNKENHDGYGGGGGEPVILRSHNCTQSHLLLTLILHSQTH